MANFSTSFGFDCYIVPLAAAEVDTAFAGVTDADDFISTAAVVSPGAVITYANGSGAGVFVLAVPGGGAATTTD